MARYSQIFTLKDIFNNKKLRGKLPLVNYKERTDESGKVHRTTRMQTIPAMVFETSKIAARPFYKPMDAHKTGNFISIGGTTESNLDDIQDAVYSALAAKSGLMSFIANSADMIRTALKEGERQSQKPKLYLRAVSMLEIENMNNKQLQALMDNVLENIFYSGNFPKTAQKYAVEQINVNSPYSYEQRKQKWEMRVGKQ